MSASSQSQIPYFGRAWQVSIQTASGAALTISNATAESLRVTFAVDSYMPMTYWCAQITIYNMGQDTASQITSAWTLNQPVMTGDRVTVCGGYQFSGGTAFNPNNNILYSGRVLQSFLTRENVVDYKLHLVCVLGLFQDAVNYVSDPPIAAGGTDMQSLTQICKTCNIATDIDPTAQQILNRNTYYRGQVFYGRPYGIISGILDQYKGTGNASSGVTLIPWVKWAPPASLSNASTQTDGTLTIRSYDRSNPPADPSYSYAPINIGTVNASNTTTGTVKYTLIGSPQQTQDGVLFRVLLDSSVNVGDTVQIAPGTLINLLSGQPNSLRPISSPSGNYIVIGVRHVGDTRGRGDDWYTEIHGVIFNFFANVIAAQSPTAQSQEAN